MNGVHDVGGMHGFGPVLPEPHEPVFHAPWEGRVLALVRAILYTRAWNIDVFRYSQEQVPAPVYLSVSYYQLHVGHQGQAEPGDHHRGEKGRGQGEALGLVHRIPKRPGDGA